MSFLSNLKVVVIWSVAFSFISAIIFYADWQNQRMAASSSTWPHVTGKINRSKIIYVTKYHNATPVVNYEFSCLKNSYTGTRISFQTQKELSPSSTDLQEEAEAVVKKYRPDSSVQVYYDPVAPNNCCLEPGKDLSSGYAQKVSALIILLAALIPLVIALVLKAKMKSSRQEFKR